MGVPVTGDPVIAVIGANVVGATETGAFEIGAAVTGALVGAVAQIMKPGKRTLPSLLQVKSCPAATVIPFGEFEPLKYLVPIRVPSK